MSRTCWRRGGHETTVASCAGSRAADNDSTLRFHPAPPPESEELERVLQRVVQGVVRVIERRGLGDEPDQLTEDDPLLAQLLAASIQGRAATGPRAGQRVLRFGDRVEIHSDETQAHENTPGLARNKGFSLHASAPPVTPAQPAPQDWSLAEPFVNRYRAVRRPAA